MASAGAFVQSAAGFGFALLFMPVAGQLLGIHQAAPLMASMSMVLNARLFYLHRKAVDWPEARRLILSALPGLAVGLLLLKYGDPVLLKHLLGVSLIAYALYALVIEPLIRPADTPDQPFHRSWMGIVAGFIAGFFGGACAVNGPPIVVYAAIRRWPRDRFKGVLQAFFLVLNTITVAAYASAGLVTQSTLFTALACVPGLIVGAYLGHHASSRLSPAAFRQAVLVLVLVLGVALVVR